MFRVFNLEIDCEIYRYVERTSLQYCGCRRRYEICNELYGTKRIKLSDDQLEEVSHIEKAEAKWEVDRAANAVFSTTCKHFVSSGSVCTECLELRKNAAFRWVLCRPLPKETKFKHTPKHLIKTNPIHEILCRSSSLSTLYQVSENDPNNFWARFANAAIKGSFSYKPVLEGLCKVMLQISERREKGKGLQNLHYSQDFTDFLVVLSSLNPQCAQLFQDNLAGRTLRSCRALRSKQSRLDYGFSDNNFEAAKRFLFQLQYDGPLAAASDCSVVVPAIRHDPRLGVLVGAIDGEHRVTSIEEIKEYVYSKKVQGDIAKYVRLYTLQVPLPNTPPYIVAALPASGSESDDDLHKLHLSFLNKS